MIRLGSAHNGQLTFIEVKEASAEEMETLQSGMGMTWPYLDAFEYGLKPGFWYDLQGGVLYPISGQTCTALSLTNSQLISVAPQEFIEERPKTKATPKQRFFRLYAFLLLGSFCLALCGNFFLEIPLLMLVWVTGATLMIGTVGSILWALLTLSSSIIHWVRTGEFKSQLGF